VEDRWFRVFRAVGRPQVRVVCFPHAGGAASAYRSWPRWLPSDVELLAGCYPGRQDRLRETPLTTMDELVTGVVDALTPLLDRPTALFGHSMGASVAFEVTRRLEATHGDRLRRLFVSGRRPPWLVKTTVDPDDDAALIAEVRRLGALDPALLEDDDLRELMLPSLRADYRVLADYQAVAGPPIRTPIVGYLGDRDPGVSVDEVREWSAATQAEFASRVFPGGHFYLVDQERALVTDLAGRLDR
jgi:pyochelin biosynthetic protein PchC